MVSLVSNTAALFAQRNLESANSASQSSISRLSSGDAIVRASDDVAGLAVGTTLATTVSTLQTVLTSTAQAGSLLSIADGGLQNIGDILQRQKSLAVQANTGSLSDNERSFLDQEFQNLVSEIDRLVTNTNFNGVNLLDGSIAGTASVSVGTVADTGIAINTTQTAGTLVYNSGAQAFAGVNNDAHQALQGDITTNGGFFATGFSENGTQDTVAIGIKIGDKTYISDNVVAAAGVTTAQTLTFTEEGVASNPASFKLGIAAGLTFSSSANADTIATNLTTDFTGIKITQSRTVSGLTAPSGNILEGIGATTIVSSNFDTTNAKFGDIGTFTGIAGSDTANSISVVINGTTFTASDIGGANDVLSSADTNLVFNGKDAAGNNTGETFTIAIGSLVAAVDVTNQDELDTFTKGLSNYFGSSTTTGTGGLNFQVGTKASDSIGLTLQSAKTTSLYKDSTGATKTLAINTAAGAIEASTVLDNAIKTVTSLRATVGGLQSRFDFASANIQSSIQNTEAARASFLDTDIAGESTKFATSQVQLQASVSVLAQANQLPQNLLELIR